MFLVNNYWNKYRSLVLISVNIQCNFVRKYFAADLQRCTFGKRNENENVFEFLFEHSICTIVKRMADK